MLIAGVSVRGFAESAARAGYDVIAVDGFTDLDLATLVPIVRLARVAGRFSIPAALAAAGAASTDAVAYLAGFENHPAAVQRLARGRVLWGNSPATLLQVRDPRWLARALAAREITTLAVRTTAPARPRRDPGVGGAWLLKPRRSGGGHGIERWREGMRVPRGWYLQQRARGVPGSIVFAADGRRVVPIGLSRILAGSRALGAGRFRYAGNILAARGDPQFAEDATLFDRASALAAAVTEAAGLVGVNGVDFVARRGVPYATEVNPRYTASMELVERAYGLSMFAVHVGACRGELPQFDLAAARSTPHRGAIGKAIVYARRDLIVGDTRAWLEDDTVRDVPRPGERIARHRPVCTVFARGRNAARCYSALAARARAVYSAIEGRKVARSA